MVSTRNCNNRQTTNGIIPAAFKVTALVIETVLRTFALAPCLSHCSALSFARFARTSLCVQRIQWKCARDNSQANTRTHTQQGCREKTRLHGICIDRENNNDDNKCEQKYWMLFSKNNSMCSPKYWIEQEDFVVIIYILCREFTRNLQSTEQLHRWFHCWRIPMDAPCYYF